MKCKASNTLIIGSFGTSRLIWKERSMFLILGKRIPYGLISVEYKVLMSMFKFIVCLVRFQTYGMEMYCILVI